MSIRFMTTIIRASRDQEEDLHSLVERYPGSKLVVERKWFGLWSTATIHAPQDRASDFHRDLAKMQKEWVWFQAIR